MSQYRRPPQIPFNLSGELIIDNFAGGGGASTGIEAAIGRAVDTVTSGGTHFGEVRAFLMKYYSEGGQWQSLKEPMHTIPTRDRIGLVMVHGEPYQIVDIGMRMLQPHELYAAQGFPADYIFARDSAGKPFTKTVQVSMCGNSVCPPIAEAIVRVNMLDSANQAAA